MKYYKLHTLKLGEQAFIRSVNPGDVRKVRNAVWYCNRKKGWRVKSTEQYVDHEGRLEGDRGFCKETKLLGVLVYRIS